MKKSLIKVVATILTCILFTVITAINSTLAEEGVNENDYSPVVQELKTLYESNPEFAETLDKAMANAVPPPNGCSEDPQYPGKQFCWQGKTIDDLFVFFDGWLKFVPNPENGMSYYQLMYDFCLNNKVCAFFCGN